MSEFAAPGSSGGFSVADADGHLVVIEVAGHETGIVTANGERDAIRATVHDVDAGETVEDALIFPKVMVGSLKGRVGQKVLARIGQGVAKPGQNPPWILQDASGDAAAVKAASDHLARYKAGAFSAPEQPAAAAPAAAPQVDLSDPNVQAALAALAAQQKGAAPF